MSSFMELSSNSNEILSGLLAQVAPGALTLLFLFFFYFLPFFKFDSDLGRNPNCNRPDKPV